jgi:hypothetical protein
MSAFLQAMAKPPGRLQQRMGHLSHLSVPPLVLGKPPADNCAACQDSEFLIWS